MAGNKPDRCRSVGDNSSQSGKNVAKFSGIGVTDSLLLKNNGTPVMAKSASGHPLWDRKIMKMVGYKSKLRPYVTMKH